MQDKEQILGMPHNWCASLLSQTLSTFAAIQGFWQECSLLYHQSIHSFRAEQGVWVQGFIGSQTLRFLWFRAQGLVWRPWRDAACGPGCWLAAVSGV